MAKDNITLLSASDFDAQVNKFVPFYSEFYNQTLEIIEHYNASKIEQHTFSEVNWLDSGCGTGTLEQLAYQRFPDTKIHFVLYDLAENMLGQAKEKLKSHSDSVEFHYASSADINYENRFDIATAIQSHHYLREEERRQATEGIYRALKDNGLYVCFEIVVPEDDEIKQFELLRWAKYKERQGIPPEESKAHIVRCDNNYFPLTVAQQRQLMKDVGFRTVQVFWRSYMQMGIYAIK